MCHSCRKSKGIYRCDNCIGQAVWCEECCLIIHKTTPFHQVKVWNGKFFKKVDLDVIGLTIFLVHGDREDEVQHGFVGDRLQMVDTTGIFSRRVRWCECAGEDGLMVEHDMQLLKAHFYPATSDRPSTAFTFNVLDEFAIDPPECKTRH
ncbi:hypothetical protein B0H10DRAFT_1810661 [Mycena sp. CBHHK59/15]|nr:hypothetical protein B0H10DRAFT_1810661 [Mycena sp. CBHHK59/15]